MNILGIINYEKFDDNAKMKDNRTELQKEFELQTPTIKGIRGNEYNLVYCAWLEHQVNKLIKVNN